MSLSSSHNSLVQVLEAAMQLIHSSWRTNTMTSIRW